MSASKSEFARVALGFLPTVYNAAFRLTGNASDADDLVQSTYEEAFRHAHQLRTLAHCKTWLFRIMRNRFISSLRKRRSRPDLVAIDGGLDVDPERATDDAPALERQVLERLSRPAIVHALSRLPEDMRTCVLLCDLEGFTYEEIAEIVRCPLGTVRSRIARARAQLARDLAEQASGLGILKRSDA
jgi:RNA polymerase sigma-70 factor (ECF subfamily)